MRWAEEYQRAESDRRAAAMVDGRHYTEHVGEVKALLRAGDDDAAAGLLLRLIEAVEREGQIPLAGCAGVPGWYFERLAAIYGKRGMAAERALIVQRQMVAQAHAETQGRIAKMRLDAALSADSAGDTDGARPTGPGRGKAAKRRASTAAAARTGRAAGKAVGMLARILGLK